MHAAGIQIVLAADLKLNFFIPGSDLQDFFDPLNFASIWEAWLAVESAQALETNRRLEQGRAKLGRKHRDLR